MIEYLRGTLLRKEPGHVVLDVNGVGYGLDVPASTGMRIPDEGEEVALYCHLYVQEQVLRLYGFCTEQEREVFEVFLGTSGIGPKTALSILSAIEIEAFVSAILREDLHTLTKLPGVGKKTAERLVVELRDKVASFGRGASPQQAGAVAAVIATSGALVLKDATDALIALGCKPAVASRAVQKAVEVLGSDAPTEDIVRESLKHRY